MLSSIIFVNPLGPFQLKLNGSIPFTTKFISPVESPKHSTSITSNEIKGALSSDIAT